MNKDNLKKILKPLIKECIREVLFEEKGALSHVISEVASGLSVAPQKSVVKESPENKWMTNAKAAAESTSRKAIMERKKKLLDSIGRDAYNGVDIFEGTTPASAPAEASPMSAPGALAGVDANDPGVNISNLITSKSAAIFKRMTEKK